MNNNVVVVPIYKNALSRYEEISLTQCFHIFKNNDIVMVKPRHLNVNALLEKYPFDNVIVFDDHFFKDIHGYNELMLSSQFYQSFLSYQFMLIYQTDAYVFKDDLNYWCGLGFDYIGAPWLKPIKNSNAIKVAIFKLKSYWYTKFNVKRNGLPKSKQFYNKVGNGGFSLRNIKLFYELSIKEKKLADYYIGLRNLAFNEDLFWSIEINRKRKRLHIPNYKIACKFSIETYPETAFEINQEKLPFGCHAWEKHLDFWKDKIAGCL